MPEINILVIEDDPGSQSAIQTMLDSEGWRVRVIPEAGAAMQELARGSWALVLASLSVTGLQGPVFLTLKELAAAAPVEDGRSRVRVLFTVSPELTTQAIPVLERERLPYAMKPFQFHDFMEKINDLLVMAKFITRTARDRGFAIQQQERIKPGKRGKKVAQKSSMFASRDEYYYTEEELAEYERAEKEEEKKKKLKQRPI